MVIRKFTRFEFSSGGAYHIQGWGEWRIRLDAGGALTITHNTFGNIQEYPPVALTPEQNQAMWNLAQAVGFDNLASSKRPGIPDEAQYTFELQDGDQTRRATIWINDASKNQSLVALVDAIGDLIEIYTGKKPVLR